MCVFFLGEQEFRDGLELYLNRYKFSNAETKDLWVALSEKVKIFKSQSEYVCVCVKYCSK